MFGVEWLAVKIIVGENFLNEDLQQVLRTCSRSSDQIANIYLVSTNIQI